MAAQSDAIMCGFAGLDPKRHRVCPGFLPLLRNCIQNRWARTLASTASPTGSRSSGSVIYLLLPSVHHVIYRWILHFSDTLHLRASGIDDLLRPSSAPGGGSQLLDDLLAVLLVVVRGLDAPGRHRVEGIFRPRDLQSSRFIRRRSHARNRNLPVTASRPGGGARPFRLSPVAITRIDGLDLYYPLAEAHG